VTFPGAAVWHVPWTDKNDAVDWQAYFHHRNRLIAALLHSPYPHGGRLVRESLNHQIKHLVSLQYSTVELRHRAIEDVLAGPYQLHETLPTALADVNAFRKQWTDAQLHADPDAFPPVRRTKPPRKGKGPGSEIPGRLSQLLTAGLAPIRQLRPVRELSKEFPEVELPAMDTRWYLLAQFDSAIVSMNDGASAALYRRDPAHYREMLRKTVAIHVELRREWPRLAAEYRAALDEITSLETWEKTLAPWMSRDD
jgi:galactofuranosylgalactofuranosylrhamnosyl-N-acetylglucosaminyl-diphospho-decaprenol beta-1,5/1,6-galactofuranosyltransferase